MATRGRGIGFGRLAGVLWCQISMVAVICVLAAPIVYGTSDAGLETNITAPALMAIVTGIAAGAVLCWRGPNHRPIRLVGPVTLASAFAVLYPISLAIGWTTSSVLLGGFTWGRGLIMGYGITALAAAIPAAWVTRSAMQAALKPLAVATTALAILAAPIGFGIPLIPLAWSHWLMMRGSRTTARSTGTAS